MGFFRPFLVTHTISPHACLPAIGSTPCKAAGRWAVSLLLLVIAKPRCPKKERKKERRDKRKEGGREIMREGERRRERKEGDKGEREREEEKEREGEKETRVCTQMSLFH